MAEPSRVSEDPEIPDELEELLGPRGTSARTAVRGSGERPTARALAAAGLSTEGREDPEPELAQGQPDFSALFADLRAQVEEAEARPSFRLKTQPTSVRRLISGSVFVGLLLASVAYLPREDLAAYPLPLLLTYLGSLGTLFVLTLFAALKPIHEPALSAAKVHGLTALAFAATCVLAVLPPFAHQGFEPVVPDALFHAVPCMIFGFVVALPVYAIVRLVDRGNPLGRILAAAAAGLAANMILEVHCPIAGAAHRGLGHAAILGVLVLGVVIVERIASRDRVLSLR
ncbi:MAG: hypothetical protein AAGH15_13020 [Myxococcota bacterium]